MGPARDGLVEALDAVTLQDPRVPVYANVSAEPACDAGTSRRLLVEQLTSPVRWSWIVDRLARAFPDALFVEMGPGSVLTGLTRRVAPRVQAQSCGTAVEVEALLAAAGP
jgi:[acyl-carrier-protein] S-malonyltransferase